MPFTGKTTYAAGSTLPEIAEDVSDLVSVVSPHETPLLDWLGDATRPARSTVHEWLEDTLLPNREVFLGISGSIATVEGAQNFRVGDLIRIANRAEVLLVESIDIGDSTITVTRGYGGTSVDSHTTGDAISIIGNAALEGSDADDPRFTARTRVTNYTQIFSATVSVSGSELAVKQIGVADELEYQKSQRTRELLRDLENTVINGVAPSSSPEGGASTRRSVRGIRSFIASNVFSPGSGIPSGTSLTEEMLNQALRAIWNRSSGQVDTILVGGREKRAINRFVDMARHYTPQSDTFRTQTQIYESDFGVCNVVLSRWVPAGTVYLLDSSRIEVLPLAGRTFHYKPLASTGDADRGQILGEYTLEFRNESAHGVINGFTA